MRNDLKDLDLDQLDLVTGGVSSPRPQLDGVLAGGGHGASLGSEPPRTGALAGFGASALTAGFDDTYRPGLVAGAAADGPAPQSDASSYGGGDDAVVPELADPFVDATVFAEQEVGIMTCGTVTPLEDSVLDVSIDEDAIRGGFEGFADFAERLGLSRL